jgi:hypothetical protein
MPRTFAIAFLLAVGIFGSSADAGLPYRILSQDGKPDAMRVAVRLDARQSDADLKAIAGEVKARLPAQQQVQSVAFYLSTAALTEAPWAEVKMLGQPVVTVRGLRLNEEASYRAEAGQDRRDRVGVWLTSPPALPGMLTIWRDTSGKVLAEWQLRSGQKTVDALHETKSQRGRRFEIEESAGGYYLLLWNGELELGSKGTAIATAERLVVEPVKVAKETVKPGIPAAAAMKPAAPAVEALALPSVKPRASKLPTKLVDAGEHKKSGTTHPPSALTFSDAITGTLSR